MERRTCALLPGLLLLVYPIAGCATPPPKAPATEPVPPTQSRAAQAQAELRAKVETLLDRSAPPADWRPLGLDALRVLEQLFNDPALQPERRLHALSAMALLDPPEASRRLATVLQDARVEARYRSEAAAALGRRGGADVASDLQKALADTEGQVRSAAARALARVGGEDARTSLEERLTQEEDPSVREVIQQSLTRLQP